MKKEVNKPCTLFWDMSSGGSTKIKHFDKIYIELPYDEAVEYFEKRFLRDPHNTTCECCGPDYDVNESVNFAQASGYHRGCRNLETPKLPDGRYDNFRKDGYFEFHFYLEDGEEPQNGYKVDEIFYNCSYETVEQHKNREDVLFISYEETQEAINDK